MVLFPFLKPSLSQSARSASVLFPPASSSLYQPSGLVLLVMMTVSVHCWSHSSLDLQCHWIGIKVLEHLLQLDLPCKLLKHHDFARWVREPSASVPDDCPACLGEECVDCEAFSSSRWTNHCDDLQFRSVRPRRSAVSALYAARNPGRART